MLKTYRVTWEIDIDADNPMAAAEEALQIQRDPEAIATVFLVTDPETNEKVEVDLDLGSVFVRPDRGEKFDLARELTRIIDLTRDTGYSDAVALNRVEGTLRNILNNFKG